MADEKFINVLIITNLYFLGDRVMEGEKGCPADFNPRAGNFFPSMEW